jgi:malate dehydrogenase (quinone)
MFDSIEFSREVGKMKEWFPLMMHGRTEDEIMATSRIDRGTEMNYGSLTEQLYDILATEYDTEVLFNTEVLDIDSDKNEDWFLKMEKAFPKMITCEVGKLKLNKMVPFYKKEVTQDLFEEEL